MEKLDKSALASKKFLAFLFAEVGFFILMGMMLTEEGISNLSENAAFMVLAVTAGVLACSYIGGQALVDRYVRVATIMARRTDAEGGEILAVAQKISMPVSSEKTDVSQNEDKDKGS